MGSAETIRFPENCPIAEVLKREHGATDRSLHELAQSPLDSPRNRLEKLGLDSLDVVELVMIFEEDAEVDTAAGAAEEPDTAGSALQACANCKEHDDCGLLAVLRLAYDEQE